MQSYAYMAPDTTPNMCTHLKVNSISKHIVDYCFQADSQESCDLLSPTYRGLHCFWNPAEITIDYGKETGLWKKYINSYLNIKFYMYKEK